MRHKKDLYNIYNQIRIEQKIQDMDLYCFEDNSYYFIIKDIINKDELEFNRYLNKVVDEFEINHSDLTLSFIYNEVDFEPIGDKLNISDLIKEINSQFIDNPFPNIMGYSIKHDIDYNKVGSKPQNRFRYNPLLNTINALTDTNVGSIPNIVVKGISRSKKSKNDSSLNRLLNQIEGNYNKKDNFHWSK